MSPPIRDGSGNSIGSIRLGDGSEISEVRTGAGDVVFSASSIPDSAIHYWPMDEGSGTTLTDNVASADFTLNSTGLFVSGDFEGGTAVQFDGSNDVADATVPVDTRPEVTLLLTVRIDTLSQNSPFLWGWSPNSFGLFGLRYNRFNSNEFLFAVGTGSTTKQAVSTTTVSSTSTKFRLAGVLDENNEIRIHVNGTQEDSVSFPTTGPQNDATQLASLAGGSTLAAATLDNAIVTDSALSPQQIQTDFNNQPWS